MRNEKGQFVKGNRHTDEIKRKIREMRKLQIYSEATRKKVSEAMKGNKNKLGKYPSEETQKKMSETHKRIGNKPPIQWGNKNRLGKKLSEETKKKISKALKGNINLLGHKPSEETKRKLSEAHKGDKNPGWKGGISPVNKRIRHSIEYRFWVEGNFARDNYTCQKCGQRGGKLHSHHIQNFAQYPELRTSIENGITFCKNCHRLFHKIYGRKNNNKEQIIEFLK